ncbi:hypothetical protein [Acinetobacter sp. HY1485]|uniref:hypothetical protein n=1 Tax=Acinetobacter sp. HY1485 TaxID=2970918 RepID=UPI0022B9C83B|nr:hypothetical protein [Acinetobacter sp. HY1485]
MSSEGNISWTAIGAITAASIAAIIAFITMVVTKENSVSQFRQDWIKEIRSELIEFIYSLKELDSVEKSAANKPSTKEYETEKKLIIEKIHVAYLKIRLKLSGMQTHDKKLLTHVDALYINFENFLSGTSSDLTDDRTNYEVIDIFLKKEWERVKGGEKWFKYSKNIILGILFSLLGGGYSNLIFQHNYIITDNYSFFFGSLISLLIYIILCILFNSFTFSFVRKSPN